MCHTVRKITLWIWLLDINPQKLVILGKHYFVIPYFFWSKSEAIWDVMYKICNCRTVWQRSSIVQCDIGPPWYFGIIINIFWVEKYFCTTILDEFHLFFIFERSQTVVFLVRPHSVTCCFFWLSYFCTIKPGRWHGMAFVIVLPSTNHNFDDFAPASKNQECIFLCHTVTAVWTRIEMCRDFFVKASLTFFWRNNSSN